MDECLYAMLFEPRHQLSAIVRAHGEDIEDMFLLIPGNRGFDDERVIDAAEIAARNLTSSGIVSIQAWQFDIQRCRLQLIGAGVHARQLMDIFLFRTVVRHHAHHLCQRVVVRRHTAGITQRTKVLSRIEAEGCCMSQCTGTHATLHSAVCLCRVLDHQQMMLCCIVIDGAHITHSAIEMHRKDAHRTFAADRFQL